MANNKKTDKPAKPAAPKADKPAAPKAADKGEKSSAKPVAKSGTGKAMTARPGKPSEKSEKTEKVEKLEKTEAEAKPAPKAEAAPARMAAPEKAEAASIAAPVAQAPTRRHEIRRRLVGRVTSNKMNKTVTVEVIRDAADPVYKKYVRERNRYKAHDETNQYKIGDRVEITEYRPMSRDKRWIVTRLVARPVEE